MSTASTSAAGTVNTRGYSAIRVVGSLLTADLIGRIGAGDPDLKGLRSEDYGLVPGRRLGEAASRRWDDLLGAYRAFQKRLADAGPGDSAVSLTRNRWLLPLFEQLGFGRLPHQRTNLTAEGRAYPISHVWGSVPIHLVAWERDLDKRRGGNGHAGGDRAPQSMLQEFLNASDDHLWGIVSNGQKLRILRDAASLSEAAFIEFDLESIFEGELYSDFVLLFALAHASRFEPHTPEGAADGGGRAEGDEAADEEGAAAPALKAPSVADCWLEKWRTEGDKTGVRFRDKLRDGLTEALQELGTGFLEDSPELRERLRTGAVSRYDLRNELLRLAYQVLFLFVAEDKGALLDPRAGDAARERYRIYFSTERLRRIAAERIGDRHDDLWRTLVIVLEALGTDEGRPELALPPLGGLYFTAGALEESAGDGEAAEVRPELLRESSVTLANRRLLAAVRHLTRVKDDGGRWQRVDYQHLDAEELGSIYESLLELIPHLDTANRTFELKGAAGNDRKTTGSYYTPSPLVETLLDSALDPVIEKYAENDVPADLLKITVCDPACGSGHFLVAAARRIARAYAVLEADDEEPTPDAVTKAMPEVVRNCIYGVDLNPLAVELTKVSLWLASLEPGKPLAFLDPHIKVGNALLGTTPKLLEQGVPDGAFKVLEGDDKKFVGVVKKQNKKERESGQISAFSAGEGYSSNVKLAKEAREINRNTKPGLAGIREQARKLRELEHSAEKQQRRRVADAWCAAFVWPKRPDAAAPVTTETVRQLEKADGALGREQTEELDRLNRRYQFFHWHLEFPEVFPGADDEREDYNAATGWQGGFTSVLGNPPWDQIELKEQEFFTSRDPEIASAAGAKRKKLIEELADHPEKQDIHESYLDEKRRVDGVRHFAADSQRYENTGRGRINTYAVFSESGVSLLHPLGRLGLIVPTGIVTDATTQYFFKDLVQRRALATVFDFENRRKIFADVDSRVKFTLLTVAGRGAAVERAEFAFFLHDTAELTDAEKKFYLSAEEILKLNPNTGTCPIFRSRRDADITLKIYEAAPVLVEHGKSDGNPWGVSFMQGLFNITSASHHFHTREDLKADGWRLDGNVFVKGEERMLPLYEAKMLHHYDHRWATYETSESARDMTMEEKGNPSALALPRYWLRETEVEEKLTEQEWGHDWLFGWRDICRTTDERTMLNAVFPRVAVPDGTLLMYPHDGPAAGLAANLSSFVLDYSARQKVGGTHLKFFTAYQLPVVPPEQLWGACRFNNVLDFSGWITPRVVELTYTAWDLESFARDHGYPGTPFTWNERRRFLLRCELDAAFFLLYGIERDDVDYIMETFPIVKKKDLKSHGSYRTKDTILEIYDAMAKAVETGEPYRTVLDPPPGEGPRHPERD
ncbi:Eco57I restriction-modification methylase domain-containing protein [Streptomonospora litoralis]|uniref:site-specific DNA-methyltransferase (adenine-specific) n=1 Tax=Streptomonospora litoralis TaxID=2498135 RepID=A0A4P6Q2J0_9ACTN|nr:DNA methyltransferase [Streptomonospora litoralis]QBI54370.1 putative type I restriction enzymeP M protein [Streptomonospora litoralis]